MDRRGFLRTLAVVPVAAAVAAHAAPANPELPVLTIPPEGLKIPWPADGDRDWHRKGTWRVEKFETTNGDFDQVATLIGDDGAELEVRHRFLDPDGENIDRKNSPMRFHHLPFRIAP